MAMVDDVGKWPKGAPESATVFGASGGIGAALVEQLLEDGCERVFAGSRSGKEVQGAVPFAFDLEDEASIASAAELMRASPPELVIVASGVLTLENGAGPERTYKRFNPSDMAHVLSINTIGPALIAKHMLPLFARDKRTVFAALSARVGSISDNGLGGWHSYRASKVALNMLLKNFAIELSRTHPEAVVLGLHPGTVDTSLSQPFQSGLPEGQLLTPARSARALMDVIAAAGPEQSGKVFDWKGVQIPA
jgi:NAD(P)-dependent dehydrogenase (short-subunit alcohol dehydrogenase family)